MQRIEISIRQPFLVLQHAELGEARTLPQNCPSKIASLVRRPDNPPLLYHIPQLKQQVITRLHAAAVHRGSRV